MSPPRRSVAAPLLAGALALVAHLLGWRGVDLPAQVYRVHLFQQSGLTLWDSQWYGGHWTLGYSVLFPPLAGTLGVTLTGILTASGAALAFDRLVVGHFGTAARFGSLLFAVGTLGQIATGQLPFLMGEAFALGACWAATRDRRVLAVALAAATSLASPMAGAFLGLMCVVWFVAAPRPRRWRLAAIALAVALPAGVMTLMFPGQGFFPFPLRDFGWELAGCVGLWLLIPRSERMLRGAVGLYALVITVGFVLPNPVGSNLGRFGECAAVPVVACLLWRHRRWLLVAAAAPFALIQWAPAWAAMTVNGRDLSSHQSYYQPLTSYLLANANPAGRVEVVPTRLHWEAAYVAPQIPLARGWERQLDTADNPLFYATGSDALTAASYRSWLLSNGVRYVALPDAPLDYAAVTEAQVINAGVPGLTPVWHDAHWRVYQVVGSTGLVDGPAQLVGFEGGAMTLRATSSGPIILRVRYSPHWAVAAGSACLASTPDHWTVVNAGRPGDIELQLRILADSASAC